MITCASCHSQELLGALFCGNCGSKLDQGVRRGHKETTENGSARFPEGQSHPFEPQPTDEEARIHLQLLAEDRVLTLAGRHEFTLGRINDNQPIIPDVDLNPYGGYEEGVSRLHAAILINHNGITVTDLGSVNGTAINGSEIPEHKPYLLTDGDVLTLGKMKMKVIIRM